MIDIELDHIRAIAEDDIRAGKCGYGCHVCGSFWTATGYGYEWHEPHCIMPKHIKMMAALKAISDIQNNDQGGDWDEIEEARNIAREALKC